MLQRQLMRDDLAIGKGLVAGDVIEVPMAEHDADALRSHALQESPDLARMCDGEVRVIDEGVVLIDKRIARGAEREAAIVEPVLLLRMQPHIGDSPVIESVCERQGLQHAQVRDGIGLDHDGPLWKKDKIAVLAHCAK